MLWVHVDNCGILTVNQIGGIRMNQKARRIVALVLTAILCLSLASAFAKTYSTLKMGDHGTSVSKLQQALKNKGYYKGKVDGIYGATTKSAVKAYQRHLGIAADGKAGDKTQKALYGVKDKNNNIITGSAAINHISKSEAKKVPGPKNPKTLYYGYTGDRVKQLQKALKSLNLYNGAVDGVYGDLVKLAVKKFQYKYGLKADGIAGPKTLDKLNKKASSKVSDTFKLSEGSKGYEAGMAKSYLRHNTTLNISEGDTFTAADMEEISNNYSQILDGNGEISRSWYNDTVVKWDWERKNP